jgi:hypothetical protein
MSEVDPVLSAQNGDRVAAELAPNERLVWLGQPRFDLATRPAWFLVPFGIVFTIISLVIFGAFAAFTAGIMAPCALPFIAAGVFLIASPIWLRNRARKVLYALTDRRAIIWEPGWFGRITIRNYTAAGLGRMSRVEGPDGSGDLVFEEITTVSSSNSGTSTYTTRRGFLCIDKVREVDELVRRTLLSGGTVP